MINERIISFLKLACILYLVAFLPKVISFYQGQTVKKGDRKPDTMLGIENLVFSDESYKGIRKLKLGVVVEKGSFTQQGLRSVDFLLQNGFTVKKIAQFIRTAHKDLFPKYNSLSFLDAKTKIPVIPLPDVLLQQFPVEFFNDIDGVIVDLCGVGLRHDRAAALLFKVLEGAAQRKKKIIVTDRINPLGSCMEGPGAIPLRHGMTLAELALYYNRHVLSKAIDLIVIPMIGWKRNFPLEGIQCQSDCYQGVYETSLASLLKEILPMQGGNGADCSQAILFAPGNEPSICELDCLKKLCEKLNLHGADCSYWNKQTKQLLKGLNFSCQGNPSQCSLFNQLLTVLYFLQRRKTILLSYSSTFDDIMGTHEVRRFLQRIISFEQLKSGIEKGVTQFYGKVRNFLLYEPFPEIGRVCLAKG